MDILETEGVLYKTSTYTVFFYAPSCFFLKKKELNPGLLKTQT